MADKGRIPVAGRVTLRVNADEFAEWVKLAMQEQRTVSSLIRVVMNREVAARAPAQPAKRRRAAKR